METLLGTYALAWAMVSAYVIWLAVGNSRLTRRLDCLESMRGKCQDGGATTAKAA